MIRLQLTPTWWLEIMFICYITFQFGYIINRVNATACTPNPLSSAVLVERQSVLGSSAYDSRPTNGRLMQYTFTQAHQRLPVLDDHACSLLGGLKNESIGASWDLHKNGISFPTGSGNRLVSERNISALIPFVSSNFSIEMWIDARDTDLFAGQSFLALFHTLGVSQGSNSMNLPEPPESGEVSIQANNINAYWAIPTDNGGGGGSTGDGTGTWVQGANNWPIHVVITYAPDGLSGTRDCCSQDVCWICSLTLTYVDMNIITGWKAYSDDGLANPLWTPSNRLYLARESIGGSPWRGRFYSFAMWNKTLSQSEINTLYNAYIPNSIPYIQGGAIQRVVAGERVMTGIRLNCTDFDIEMNATWPVYELRPNTPYDGFQVAAKPTSLSPLPLVFKITSYPTKGMLYLKNGIGAFDEIDQSWIPFDIQAIAEPNGVWVYYQSIPYDYGVEFDSFSYQVSDQISPINATAMVVIDVAFVDNPPLPIDQHLNAYSEIPLEIDLGGTDPDVSDGLHRGSVYINYLPTIGTLYQVSPTTDAITTSPTLVTDPAFRVTYISDPLSIDAQDYMEFTLIDEHSMPNAFPGIVLIDVVNNLQALNDITICNEETAQSIGNCLVELNAINPFNIPDVSFDLLTLPSYGYLGYQPNSSVPIILNPLHLDLPLSLALNSSLWYISPDIGWNGNDTFVFRVVHDGYYSSNGTKTIVIMPIGDAPTITGPDDVSVLYLQSTEVVYNISDIDESNGVPPIGAVYFVRVDGSSILTFTINPDVSSELTFQLGNDHQALPNLWFSGSYANIIHSLSPLTIISNNQGAGIAMITVIDETDLSVNITIAVTIIGGRPSSQLGNSVFSNTELWLIWSGGIVGFIGLLAVVRWFINSYIRKPKIGIDESEKKAFDEWKQMRMADNSTTATTTTPAAVVSSPPPTGGWTRLFNDDD